MPTRENIYLVTSDNRPVQEFTITTLQVDQLVSEIKENLKLSPPSMKTRSQISRKCSRASPYNITSSASCVQCGRDKRCLDCLRKQRFHKQQHKQDQTDTLDDPYELLQKLLRDGGLIQEAVRRVQLGFKPKQTFFYDSEEDVCTSPVRKFIDNKCSHESAKCDNTAKC